MATTIRYMISGLLLVSAPLAGADTQFDPDAHAKSIAPFIDTQTVAVAHIDLTGIEPGPLVDTFVKLVPEAQGEVDRDEVKRILDGFVDAGARELYVVATLADWPSMLYFVVVPHVERVDRDAFVANLEAIASLTKNELVVPLDDALVFGHRRTIERLKSIKPDVRPDLADAFRAAGDADVQVLLLPTDNDRRVVEELMPTLPEQIGGGPSTILTRGVRWLALGIDAPPKISLRLTVQSADAKAAAALRAKWQEVVGILSKQQIPRRGLQDIDKALALLTPEVEEDRLVLRLDAANRSIEALLAAVAPPFEHARNETRRKQSVNNLKHIGLAMHNFYDAYKRLPAIGTFDATGKPLLSWRVHILPYVEQKKLYDQFRRDEPWDSEHNRKLIAKMPEIFRCPASKHKAKHGLATYRLVVGEHTPFPRREGIELKQIIDGTSNTIMAVEVDDEHAVEWTKPEGLPFNAENPADGLGGQFEGGFQSVFCDGSAHFIPLPHDAKRLRCLLMRDDRTPISW